MIIRRRVAIALALAAYVGFAILLAPATLMDAGVNGASGGRVRLAEAQGTIWSGSGQLEVRESSGRRGIGRPFSWRFKPASLFLGRLAFEVDIANTHRNIPLAMSWFGLEIGKAKFVLPAASLALAIPRLAALDPGGDLLVDVSRLRFEEGAVSGDATVEWPNASSSISPVSPLGSYRIRFVDGTGGMTAVLASERGPLFLEGSGTIGKKDATRFQASATINPRSREQLEPFLRLVAIERGDGNFDLQLNQGTGTRLGSVAGASSRQ